jgi:hypothetical protein
MDTVNFEPSVPTDMNLEEKRRFFSFTDKSDNYPPHLNLAGNKPVGSVNLQPFDIFSKMRLLQLSSLLPTLIPQNFIEGAITQVVGQVAVPLAFGQMGTPDKGTQLAEVEVYNRKRREQWIWKDIFDLPNVGDLKDWYSDTRFAQQHFTGTNPTTIEKASQVWISHFSKASTAPEDTGALNAIKTLARTSQESLYVQDYSYFRKAAGIVDESAAIKCEYEESYKDGKTGKTQTRKSYRYGCASVCLFHLNDAGVLQPLAIVIDWRGSAENSVTIYNRELIKRDAYMKRFDPEAGKAKTVAEAHDWAWRYGE